LALLVAAGSTKTKKATLAVAFFVLRENENPLSGDDMQNTVLR
jgi:hypothetical protein